MDKIQDLPRLEKFFWRAGESMVIFIGELKITSYKKSVPKQQRFYCSVFTILYSKELHRPCTIMRLVSVHLVLNNKHSVSTVRVACPNSRTNILKDDYWQQRVMVTYSFDLTEWLKNRLFHYSTNTIWFLTVV